MKDTLEILGAMYVFLRGSWGSELMLVQQAVYPWTHTSYSASLKMLATPEAKQGSPLAVISLLGSPVTAWTREPMRSGARNRLNLMHTLHTQG